ncbi:hypothetical protein [Arcobacter ellisii]|uniref:hypothetical protein n=1 Tax=Arcobacter ellisii TaxID=913109 RepID=UPI00100BECB6|nr:hypothetical protein [Arcobacter ellisii]
MMFPFPVSFCCVLVASVVVAVNVTVSSFSVIASSLTVTFTSTEYPSAGRVTFPVAGTSNHVVPPSVEYCNVFS